VKLAKAERIPDVNLDLLYRRLEGSRENAFDVGVRIPIPLFDSKRKIRQAEQELRGSEARFERVRNQIGLEQHELELGTSIGLGSFRTVEKGCASKNGQIPDGNRGSLQSWRYKSGRLAVVRREHAAARLQYA
jgi:hypothetical protein